MHNAVDVGSTESIVVEARAPDPIASFYNSLLREQIKTSSLGQAHWRICLGLAFGT